MNHINPAISIIVPMYNVEKYIGYCLDSIMNQTFGDYELILIDDASTDSTYELSQKACQGIPAVTLMKNQKNHGRCYSRNRGLEIARGKYIYFMDNDDELAPVALEVLYRKAEAEQADVVHTNYYIMSCTEGRMISKTSLWEFCSGMNREQGSLAGNVGYRLDAYEKNMPMPWLNLIRKDFLKNNKIFFRNLDLSEDDVFSLELFLKAKKIVMINEYLNIFRRYYPHKERQKKRLPLVLGVMGKIFEAYDDIFRQYTLEEIPANRRLNIFTSWLNIHLQLYIYEALDTREPEDYLYFKKILESSDVKDEFSRNLIPLLVNLIDNCSSIRGRMEMQVAD